MGRILGGAQKTAGTGPAPGATAKHLKPPDSPSWPKPLVPEAIRGEVGEAVKAIEPASEADPAAILLQTLCCAGNIVGRGPHFTVEADRHGLNLFTVPVGLTSKGWRQFWAGQKFL